MLIVGLDDDVGAELVDGIDDGADEGSEDGKALFDGALLGIDEGALLGFDVMVGEPDG